MTDSNTILWKPSLIQSILCNLKGISLLNSQPEAISAMHRLRWNKPSKKDKNENGRRVSYSTLTTSILYSAFYSYDNSIIPLTMYHGPGKDGGLH